MKVNGETYTVAAVGRGGYAALERGDDRVPFTLSPSGELFPARDGDRFFLSFDDDDVIFATEGGWRKSDDGVRCFGAFL